MLEYHQEEEYTHKDFDARLLRRMLKYVLPYKWNVALSTFLLLLVAGFELLGPVFTKHAIDVNIAGKDIQGLIRTVLLFFAVLVVSLIARFAQLYITRLIGQKAVLDLRMDVFSHLQKLSVSYYDRNPVGRLMTRVTSDVQALDESLSAGLIAVFGDIFTITGIVIAMLWMNWRLALVTFTLMPLVFLASFIFRRYARAAFRQIRLRVARINSFMNENITGMAVNHLFNLSERNNGKFEVLNRSYLDATLKTIFYFALFFPVIELLSASSMALIVGYGGKLILGGTMTLGALIAFLQYSERFFRPIRDLSDKYNILQNALAASERIFALLDTKPDISISASPVPIGDFQGRVEFRNVTFGYDKSNPVVKNVSFIAEPGKTLAIVGHTGAGKTTLINLLCRFYDVDEGEILLDGLDIRRLHPAVLRRRIGLVQQDLFLFNGTVRENICIDKERISRVGEDSFADAAWLSDFIASLPDGYDSKIGERGASISTGQRQLLSFARALSVDPKILLLDEATSSVDTETEALIQEAMKILFKGRTSIVVAHRLSTIREADNIIVMHRGEAREMGRHEELLAQEGIYYRLYRMHADVNVNAV